MSARKSMGSPRICSGDMYRGVPLARSLARTRKRMPYRQPEVPRSIRCLVCDTSGRLTNLPGTVPCQHTIRNSSSGQPRPGLGGSRVLVHFRIWLVLPVPAMFDARPLGHHLRKFRRTDTDGVFKDWDAVLMQMLERCSLSRSSALLARTACRWTCRKT